jgi:hypothetical protein
MKELDILTAICNYKKDGELYEKVELCCTWVNRCPSY